MVKPASQGNSVSNDPKRSASTENSHRQLPESKANDIPTLIAQLLSLIDLDLLSQKLKGLLEEKPSLSKLQRLQRSFSSPLAIVLVSFFLTGVLGTYITYFYSKKQKDLEYQRSNQQKDLEYQRSRQQQELSRQRSYSDELNKARMPRIGQVWETIDKNEIMIDDLLDQTNKAPLNQDKFDKLDRLIEADVMVVKENRFWLGEEAYNQIKVYLDITGRYILDRLFGRSVSDLEDTIKKRELAKQDILKLRSMFLRGEPEPYPSPSAVGK